MKTINIISLTLLAGIVLFTACTKEEPEFTNANTPVEFKTTRPGVVAHAIKNWRDDFLSAASLDAKWYLFGTPQPLWVSNANGKFGLFDNNGRYPGGGYAISKNTIGDKNGYTIESEVCIDLENTRGAFISPEIGVTRKPFVAVEPNTIEAGLSMKLMYIGTDVAGIPPVFQDHTYVVMSALTEDGAINSTNNNEGKMIYSGDYAFQTDFADDGWHKVKIVVTPSQKVAFYLDGQLVWSPKEKVHSSLLKGKNLMLGYTSPGESGKAYHNYIQVSYPTPDEIGRLESENAGR